MDKETWNRIQELLPEYLKTPESDRDAFLEQHCEGNEALARQIRKLAITPGSGFLEPVDGLDEPTDAPYPRGTRIGEFEISLRIGSGAMGVVYLARQESVSRDVALKVLPAEWGAHTERLARFKTEAIAAAKLHHPNIVQVHSAGVDAGRYYIAMEFVDGPDLATVIKDLKAGRRAHATIPAFDEKGYARRIAEVIRTMAVALDYAHHRAILHRDVKPSNILLDANGEPYLADFGLARDLGADGISGSHQVLGTPHYMSPEMVRARRVAIDHRTDVFSLGAVLYELLTLRRPFASGETSIPTVLAAITDSDPPGLRRQGVHPDLETICFKALDPVTADDIS